MQRDELIRLMSDAYCNATSTSRAGSDHRMRAAVEALEATGHRITDVGDEDLRKREQMIWLPLYGLAFDLMVHNEANLAVWRDKLSPATIQEIEQLRQRLFAACAHAREVSGMSAAEIKVALAEITPK